MSQTASALTGVHGERIALSDVSVSAVLRDLLAEVTVSQVYRNDEPVNIEAVYTFPLPLDAVLLELHVDIGGRTLKGVVVEKASAEAQYEHAIEAGDAAVMLEALEPGLYTMNVGNMKPHETATITFTYALVYRWTGDQLRVHLPTTIAPRYGVSPHQLHQAPESSLTVEHEFSLRLEISGSLRDAQFVCPSHPVTLSSSPELTVIALKEPRAAMDRDFVLNVKAPQAARHFALCGADDGEVAAMASFQPMFPGLREPRALNLAIVIDCSGSMAGDSIAQAKRALEGIINTLQPHDRVTIIGFGNTTKAWSAQLLPCTTANLAAARGFAVGLEADMGGTEIGLALQAAYAATRGSEQADLFVVTDGEVSSWQAVVDEAKRSGRRVFTVGVGSAVSEGFVRALASATGGSCELVSPREGMSDRVIRHFERMRAPRARRVAVHWPEGAHDMSPTQFTAVFEGDTVIATARCGKALTSNIVTLEIETERGDVFRQDVSMAMPVEADAPISTVARLAAAARLHELDREAGLATALRYRLVSAWTNWLVVAVRPDEEKALDMPAIRKVPQTMAAGWGGVGSVMASAPSMDLMACLSIEDSAPSLRRPRRPKALRRLLELIDAHPGRLVPEHAFDLLDHAGLVAECGDLFTKGARLGLDPNAIAAMLLARLLDGPLAEFLPPEAQRSLGLLQDYADAAMAILDEAGHRTHELFRLLETGIKRGVFRPEMLREPDPRLMGLTTCRDLLVQVDEVVRRLGSRPSRPSPNYS